MEFYHLLNRGVDKRKIFLEEKDYFRFVHDLFEFNDQNPTLASNNYYFKKQLFQSLDIGCPKIGHKTRKLLVNIHAWCLMPNHYHLLVSPLVEDGISRFMKKLNMGYAKYFNEKNNRTGALFQGKYKSMQVTNDSHFLYLPYYIHLNPLDLKMPEWRENKIRNSEKAFEYLRTYRWSSHIDYLGIKNFPSVTQRKFLLDFFGGEEKYTKLVNKYLKEFDTTQIDTILLE